MLTRRRVVTGLDVGGRSIIASDGQVPSIFDFDTSTVEKHWIIDQMPRDVSAPKNPADNMTEYSREPPKGGVAFQTFTIQPGVEGEMHVTNTLDFLVVLVGELTLIMEKGETVLHPGDTIIQRATNHAWANRGDEMCVVADVMISMHS